MRQLERVDQDPAETTTIGPRGSRRKAPFFPRQEKPRADIREFIALGGLDDTIEDEDVAVGGGLEDENVLVERLLNVENLLDLEGHGLAGPEGAGLLEPTVLDLGVSEGLCHCRYEGREGCEREGE